MTYTRGGRPLVQGGILAVEDLSLEGMLIKTYTKAGKVPKGYFQVRNNVKVSISKEEYEQIRESRRAKE